MPDFTGDAGRRAFLVLTGIALFVAGSLYLYVDTQQIDSAYIVTGGPESPSYPGTLAFRVTGRLLGQRVDVRVDATSLRVVREDGSQRLDGASVAPGQPLTLVVPAAALKGATALSVDLTGQAGDRTVEIPIEAFAMGPGEWPLPTSPAPLGEGSPHRIELIPAGGALVSGVQNAVLARVTDAAGRPLEAARIELVTDKKGEEPLEGTTDTAGLATIAWGDEASRRNVTIGVKGPQGDESAHQTTLFPGTLKTRLVPAGVVLGPVDELARLDLLSHDDDAMVYCDLWRDGAMVWATTVALLGGTAPLHVPVPGLGPWRLQCAYHPASPGGAYATALLVRTEGATLAPLREAVAQAGGLEADWLAALPAEGDLLPATRERLIEWLASRSTFDPTDSVVLVDTGALDAAALGESVAHTRSRLLLVIGAIFAIMVLWMVLNVVLGYRSVRKGYARYQEGEGEFAEEPGEQTMSRSRAMVQVSALVLIVILNIVAVILLLGIVV